jgi:hypothetical protein
MRKKPSNNYFSVAATWILGAAFVLMGSAILIGCGPDLPVALAPIAFVLLLDFASAAMQVDPDLWLTFVLDAILQLHQTINNGLGSA